MNCKVNRLQAIMLFQCSSHAHHSAQRLSITPQHTPTHHLHCSGLHSAALAATQLLTSVEQYTTLFSFRAVLCHGSLLLIHHLFHYVTSPCHHTMALNIMPVKHSDIKFFHVWILNYAVPYAIYSCEITYLSFWVCKIQTLQHNHM